MAMEAGSTQELLDQKTNRLPQYIAGISATIGGFVMGTTLGWSSPTQAPLQNSTDQGYSFLVTSSEFSLVGSLLNAGAILGAAVGGTLCTTLGRRGSIMALCPICLIGWALILWAVNASMMIVGRVVLGFVIGGMSVASPLYTNEIAEIAIRGTLGTYFQLQVTMGILFVYVVGAYVTAFNLSLICGIFPIILFGLMFLMPETPKHRLLKGNHSAAVASLKKLRGSHYNPTLEINVIQQSIDEMNAKKLSMREAFSTVEAKKGMLIGLAVMFFQQFSGINAVIFYTTDIFHSAGVDMDSSLSTIIVGGVSVVATYISTLIVDRLGRKPMLIVSDLVMAISISILGLFYTLSSSTQSSLGWLPLTCVCVFITLFSLGYGPIPWMYISEIFAPEILGPACSIACLFNWACSLLVTLCFSSVVSAIGNNFTYWSFGIISAIGTVFGIFFIPETKGKTLEEVLQILRGGK